tara:strand:+ start:294 stop:518 length:225 start_codon:yes stop_codon:yes gene_type:complete
MHNLTKAGQIKNGAQILLSANGEGQAHTVDEVLHAGTDGEEILLNVKENLYFITSMAIDGTSWAKQVKFLNHNA